MTQASVSAAGPERLDDLRALYLALHDHERTLTPIAMTPDDRAWSGRRATYARALAEGRGVLVVAERGGAPVGYAFALLGEATDETFALSPRLGELYTLVVAPGSRGAGIGTRLVHAVEEELERLGATALTVPVMTGNRDAIRFYRRFGLTPVEVVLYRLSARSAKRAPDAVRIEEHVGARRDLRRLFELAEDSATELDGYLDAGRVLVALEDGRPVGHLQLTETDRPERLEIKNMAVAPSQQGRGIGRALVEAAIRLARDERRSVLVVATAAADVGNLGFYQRVGFRLRSIERDAFTEAVGYAPGLRVEGIEVRDRVWLDASVGDLSPEVVR